METFSLICSGCGITFQVIPCQKGRKFCSHECYLKHIPKGKDWKGGTLRGKGSRGPYSESSVKQRADEEKYRTYESLKIPYLVIWEHEINELPIQEIENRILLGVINARKKWNN